MDYVGKLFEDGRISILVGTKSLLGEGWDSPCVNTLILASFVGSYVLSNQMRGRAIRIDPNAPDKSANIWHLVTLEPEYLFTDDLLERANAYLNPETDKPVSYDYETVKRRFDTFMGPNYTTGAIESGIERLSAIKPPFDKKGVESINEQMLALAGGRDAVKQMWSSELNGNYSVKVDTETPKQRQVPVFTFYNYILIAVLAFVQVPLVQAFIDSVYQSQSTPVSLFTLVLIAASLFVLYGFIRKLVLHLNPVSSIQTLGIAVWKTLCDCGLISPTAKVEADADKYSAYVSLTLRNATIHEQNIFNTAMTELLSPIDNPRYIIVAGAKRGLLRCTLSFACPSVIGRKKEYAELLASNLKNTTGRFQAVYTRTEAGRRLIIKCRQHSYISHNEKMMNKILKVSHYN